MSRSIWGPLLALGLLVSLGGCGTTPETRYFTLTPSEPAEERALDLLYVSRVQMPDYLDDTRIWVRTGEHQVGPLPHVRWVESFPRSMTRSLQRQLGDGVAEGDDAPRLIVDVHRFEARWTTEGTGDRVVMTVLWQVEGDPGSAERLTLEEPLPDRDAGTLVEAKSLLVYRLGEHISDHLAAE